MVENGFIMNWSEWVEKYKPLKNQYGDIQMFETYGTDVEFVKSQPENKIWTLADAGEGSIIVSGWHVVNRIGYYITDIPFEKETWVDIEEDEWDEGGDEDVEQMQPD